jgi:hypothetical protein
MSERIQKLIEQATFTQGPTPYNPLTFEVFDKEKFAELIVRECANKVDSNLRDWLLDNSGGTMGDKILEHFGVEE